MYLKILRKDLRRKKTMNLIILLFVVMATMFAASSVSNIIAAMNGTEHFFRLAGLSDLTIIQFGGSEARRELEETLAGHPADVRVEESIVFTAEQLSVRGKAPGDFNNVGILMPVGEAKLRYFTAGDSAITAVNSGETFVADYVFEKFGLDVGDRIGFSFGDTYLELQLAGRCKDAPFGSPVLGNPHFIISDDDYAALVQSGNCDNSLARIVYVNSDDCTAISSAAMEVTGVQSALGIEKFRLAYIVDIVVAAALLVISIALILIAVTVLRFAISFTIAEELREIGVMKAIGIRSRNIRLLYLAKYIALAVIGSITGFFASIPFARYLIGTLSRKLVLSSQTGVSVNLISAAAVVAAVFVFSWSSTSDIEKTSSLDAIRSGQNGERFSKKRGIRLGSLRTSAAGSLALNDIISSPRRYIPLAVTFTLSLTLVLILSIFAHTLSGDALLPSLCMTRSDVYIYSDATDEFADISAFTAPEGEQAYLAALSHIEDELNDIGLCTAVSSSVLMNADISCGGRFVNVPASRYLRGNSAADIAYTEGTAPENSAELAVSRNIADELGAHIGDTLTLKSSEGESLMIVSAIFDTMGNLGDLIILPDDIAMSFENLRSPGFVQINFTDSPSPETAAARTQLLKEKFGSNKVRTSAEAVSDSVTGAADIINVVKRLVLGLTAVTVTLVTVLMERSFIADEKSEIALMKAIGFSGRAIGKTHTLRFCIIATVSAAAAVTASMPLTKLFIDPVFSLLGSSSIKYTADPIETFAAYPAAIILLTAAAALLTSLCTRNIKPTDTANKE